MFWYDARMEFDPAQVFSPRAFAGRAYGITGGSRGIGRATVTALLELGASVMTIANDEPGLEHLRDSLPAGQRPKLLTVRGDVADAAALAGAVEQAAARFGRLDGWVNNAMYNPCQSLAEHDEAAFVRAWEVNLLSAWRAARLCLPHFRAAGRASIVNISSIRAHQTAIEQTAYTSSKAALEGLTRALAIELAPLNIRVNTITPGYINTFGHFPLDPADYSPGEKCAVKLAEIAATYATPLPVRGLAPHVAAPILFLLSDAACFISGAELAVDAGVRVDIRRPGEERFLRAHQEIERVLEKFPTAEREP